MSKQKRHSQQHKYQLQYCETQPPINGYLVILNDKSDKDDKDQQDDQDDKHDKDDQEVDKNQ